MCFVTGVSVRPCAVSVAGLSVICSRSHDITSWKEAPVQSLLSIAPARGGSVGFHLIRIDQEGRYGY